MNRGIVVGAAAGLLAIAVGAGLWVRGTESPEPGAVPALSVSPQAAPVAVAPFSRPASAVPAAPAAGAVVSRPLPADQTPAGLVMPGAATPADRAAVYQSLQARLQKIAAEKQPDLQALDGVLAELQRHQGSDVVGGVNLQLLRDNLARSDRMRRVAEEMQALAAAPPTAETAAQLQARVAEIQRLQAGLNPNVAAPAGAAR